MDIFSQVLALSNLYRSESKELAALGSAIGAGLAVGVYANVEEAISCCRVEKLIYEEHDRKRYKQLSEFFRSLYPAMRNAFKQLSSLDDAI